MPALRSLAIISTLLVLGPVCQCRFEGDNTNRRDDARSTVIFLGTMFNVQLFMLASSGIKSQWRDHQRPTSVDYKN
jgi:hypothetical protein